MQSEKQDISQSPLSPHDLVIPGIVFGLSMVLLSFILANVIQENDVTEHWYPLQGTNVLLEIALGLILGLVGVVVAWLATESFPSIRKLRAKLLTLFNFDELKLWHALAFGLMASIPEEILFRGTLQPALGIMFTSLLFGMLHTLNKAYIVYAALAGLCLGILFEWRGNLYAATAAHFIYDVGLFLLMAWWVKSR